MSKFWKLVTILLTAGFLSFAGLSWHVAKSRVSPAPDVVGDPPTDFPRPVEAVSFTTRDGLTIRGWHSIAAKGYGTVVLLHPYRCNRLYLRNTARMLAEAGYGVLLYDARGCGESDGDLISLGYYETEDLLAALAYLKDRNATNVACLGRSQGGATILMASDRFETVRAVICESTYDTFRNAIDRRSRMRLGLPGWATGMLVLPMMEHLLETDADRISPLDAIPGLRVPLLMISGEEDRRCPPEDVRRLFAAAGEPKELWMIPGAKHEDLHSSAPADYRRRVLAFLDHHLPGDSKSPQPAQPALPEK